MKLFLVNLGLFVFPSLHAQTLSMSQGDKFFGLTTYLEDEYSQTDIFLKIDNQEFIYGMQLSDFLENDDLGDFRTWIFQGFVGASKYEYVQPKVFVGLGTCKGDAMLEGVKFESGSCIAMNLGIEAKIGQLDYEKGYTLYLEGGANYANSDVTFDLSSSQNSNTGRLDISVYNTSVYAKLAGTYDLLDGFSLLGGLKYAYDTSRSHDIELNFEKQPRGKLNVEERLMLGMGAIVQF